MATSTAIPSDQLSLFMSVLWRIADTTPTALVGQDPEISRMIEASTPEVARALQRLVDRLDNLSSADRLHFAASVDEVQIRSKLWLIRELTHRTDLADAYMIVLGAWFGVLPLLIDLSLDRPPARMVCIDVDGGAVDLGRRVVQPLYSNIDYLVADAMDLDYADIARQPSSVLVNTICEHLDDVPGWWAQVASGQFAVLQSNNYDLCRDHVNCVASVEEMHAQTPMATVLYQGALHLPIFDRFMLVGIR
jgi:hypothetical protein